MVRDERILLVCNLGFLLAGAWAVSGGIYWRNWATVFIGLALILYALRGAFASEAQTDADGTVPSDD